MVKIYVFICKIYETRHYVPNKCLHILTNCNAYKRENIEQLYSAYVH